MTLLGIPVELLIAFVLLGALVGCVAGLLGVGGGGITIPLLSSLFVMYGFPKEHMFHLASGTSMAVMILTSYASFKTHHYHQNVRWDIVKILAPSVIIGTFATTFLVTQLNNLFLTLFFSGFMLFVAIQMFRDSQPHPHRRLFPKPIMALGGLVIGSISAMVSIGGGSLTVPFLHYQNIDVKKTIGTSAAMGFPIAIAGTLGFAINGYLHPTHIADYALGFVYVPAAILMAGASFLTAPLGAKLAHQLPKKTLKRIFGMLLFLLSLKMLWAVW